MKFNLPENYQGRGESNAVIVTSKGTVLPKRHVTFVKLINPSITDSPNYADKPDYTAAHSPPAPTATNTPTAVNDNATDVFWGFSGIYPNILKAGETTDYIPIKDLSQLYLKSRNDTSITIYYDVFF